MTLSMAYRPAAALLLMMVSMAAANGADRNNADSDQNANWHGPYPWNYSGTREREARPARIAGACPATATNPRVLIAGDSWAQFMWDDDSHNQLFDRFGHADKLAVSRSLGSNPGPGHSGPEYAISGSEAREWVNTASYPWIANVVSELQALPSIDTVVFSLGGNDVLAGRSGGGWYKDMDLDTAGSEAALFARILADSDNIVQAFQAVRPELDVLVSSYEYPNFNVSALWCFIYACPKRRDLSRDPDNDLVSDAQINAMIVDVEATRIAWTNADPRLLFDHAVGEMHHYYGDGVAAPGVLPRPGQQAPDYLPFPAGQPSRPSLRSNFRTNFGISADPIHLDPEGYLYKVAVQAETHFFPRFRGEVTLSLFSQGGAFDGWTDGVQTGTNAIIVGDDGSRLVHGIVSFDTSAIPADAVIESATLYLLQDGRSGSNPFTSGALGLPRLDVASGGFGAPEVEPGDATAAADASDVGCFVGSVANEFDALRIDVGPAGLAAMAGSELTQFRLSFVTVNGGIDNVRFKDGDTVLTAQADLRTTVDEVQQLQPDGTTPIRQIVGSALTHRGLAEAMGSARPFLDIRYRSDAVFANGFE